MGKSFIYLRKGVFLKGVCIKFINANKTAISYVTYL